MYTGKTERPCCLCDDPSVHARIDLPPRAVQLLKHSDPIAWRDIVGEVSIYFCEDDWETVRELVLETGMSPLSRCNVARASFDLREDFEALLNETRAEPDQRPIEREFRERTEAALSDPAAASEQELVEARVVRWAMEDLADEA